MNFIAKEKRDAARAAGEKTFFSDTPCKHGHVAPRYVSDGRCKTCKHNRNDSFYSAKKTAPEIASIASRRSALGVIPGARVFFDGKEVKK